MKAKKTETTPSPTETPTPPPTPAPAASARKVEVNLDELRLLRAKAEGYDLMALRDQINQGLPKVVNAIASLQRKVQAAETQPEAKE
jgi:hypothetical protein